MTRTRNGTARLAGLVAAAAAVGLLAFPHPTTAATITRPPGPESQAAYDLAADAPVLIVLGQSNAVGYGAPVTATADSTLCSNMPDVRGLRANPNRVAGATTTVWGAYTCSGSNLGETGTGASYNTASAFAMRWQRAINGGAKLPDLHVIHVAWKSQGLAAVAAPNDRWRPGRTPNAVDGLHQLTMNTLGNAFASLRAAGKVPRVLGLHWNQWETDALAKSVSSVAQAKTLFTDALTPFRAVTGRDDFPIYLYRPRSTTFDAGTTKHITDAFVEMASAPAPNPFQLIDPADAKGSQGGALYNASAAPNYGIFGDGVHYTAAVQRWFADVQWQATFTDGNRGAPVPTMTNVALGKPATQSSDYHAGSVAGPAGDGVDGDISGRPTESLTITDADQNAWWQVDLGSANRIESIKILNRTDCCATRLSNFSVFVSPTDPTGRSYADLSADPAVFEYRVNGTAPRQLTVPVGATGQYVRVQLAGTDHLSLAEVQALA